jgi:uncharacterized protein YkwD
LDLPLSEREHSKGKTISEHTPYIYIDHTLKKVLPLYMKSSHSHIKTISAGLLMATLATGFSALPASANVSPSTLAPATISSLAAPMATQSDSFAKQTFDLINAERAKIGVRPLVWNQPISDISQNWSDSISAKTMDGTFDWATIHRADAGGSLLPKGATSYSEIIGFNVNPKATVEWWMNSPGHKAAMLDSRATHAGLGYTIPTSGPYSGMKLTVVNIAAYSNGTPGPTPVKTALSFKGSEINGMFGKATSAEVYGLKGGGGYQMYARGAIVWSPATGAHTSTGGIRTSWAATGFENGYLGYPTTDEIGGLKDGGVYQMYQGGAIIWSPATGSHISTGGIRTTWAATGFENGYLGYPTTDEIGGLKNGGVYQVYQGGVIYWSPSTGAYVTTGGIRNAWLNTGSENGRLGYPVSNEIKGANGSVVQHFQGGSITWTPGSINVNYR